MSDIVDRLADPGDEPDAWAGTATVTATSSGSTPDGRRLITVDWQDTDVTCAYLASYTPVVGDRVTFLKSGPSLLVLGKPATL